MEKLYLNYSKEQMDNLAETLNKIILLHKRIHLEEYNHDTVKELIDTCNSLSNKDAEAVQFILHSVFDANQHTVETYFKMFTIFSYLFKKD